MASRTRRIIRCLPLLFGSFERRAVTRYGLTPEDARRIARHLSRRDRLSRVYALYSAFAPSIVGAAIVAIVLIAILMLLASVGMPADFAWPRLVVGIAIGSYLLLQVTLYTHAQFTIVDRHMRRHILDSLCAACDYDLCGQIPTEDGYVRCPECGVVVPCAEWLAAVLEPEQATASSDEDGLSADRRGSD